MRKVNQVEEVVNEDQQEDVVYIDHLTEKYFLYDPEEKKYLPVQWTLNKPINRWLVWVSDTILIRKGKRWPSMVQLVEENAVAFAYGHSLRTASIDLARQLNLVLYSADPKTYQLKKKEV